MTIETFIEKAIEGGWKPYGKDAGRYEIEKVTTHQGIKGLEKVSLIFDKSKRDETGGYHFNEILFDEIVLDRLAWQAVGKVEGWGDVNPGHETFDQEQYHITYDMKSWQFKQWSMIDALAEGKSIEEHLQSL